MSDPVPPVPPDAEPSSMPDAPPTPPPPPVDAPESAPSEAEGAAQGATDAEAAPTALDPAQVEAAHADAAAQEEAAREEAAREGAHDAPEAAPAPAHDEEEDHRPARPTGHRARAKGSPEARERALARLARGMPRGSGEHAAWIVEALERGYEPVYLGRFRRENTGGLDERRLFELRDAWRRLLAEEERRVELRELLVARGALTDDLATRIAESDDLHAMEDLAAPWLPVTASRATVARGHGLQALADAIRGAKEATPLSEVAKPFAQEGAEVATLDAALGGARDILAEAFCLDVALRRRLRELFRRESVMTVALRTDRKGDAGRHAGLLGLSAPLRAVPPLKLLAIRRGERERVLAAACEPPEEKAIEAVHDAVARVFGAEHPHAGFLRAAAEDGYRRILKPLLQAEIRAVAKERADEAATDTFERSLRNLLLGPVGGARRTLGIRPDVTAGHRVGAVDEAGRTVHAGRLPHEPVDGREQAVEALRALIEAHGVDAVAVGQGGGRKEALSLAAEATQGLRRPVEVAEVPDGGTRALEEAAVQHPVRTESGVEVPAECVGALSIARRFQDPLAEYVRLDPKTLGLGPNLHDVHQGRLKERLDDVIASCTAHVGPDAATAPAEVLARLPGMDPGKARAFAAWRDAGNALPGKAALAAVEGVGPVAAEQAVGFVRVSTSEDPRDRTQLHPEQFGLVEEMARQVGTDVAGLFQEPRLRARVDLAKLERPDAPMPVLKYVLYQATAGLADPRPRWAVPTKPPPGVTIDSLRPGLVLEGRVTRAVPFGVFVDVGLGAEALLPLPHIGDRPGVDPATIAPVGAVVQGRVLEVDPTRRRLTLTMRHDPGERRGGPRGPRFEGPPRGERGPRPEGAGVVPRAEGPRPEGPPRGRGRSDGPRPERGRFGEAKGRGAGERPARRVGAAPSRGFGRGAGAGVGRDRGARRFDRDDPHAPRRISLPAEAPPPEPKAETDEGLSEAEKMARMIAEMKRRLERSE